LLLQNTKIINKPDFTADNLGIAGYYFDFYNRCLMGRFVEIEIDCFQRMTHPISILAFFSVGNQSFLIT